MSTDETVHRVSNPGFDGRVREFTKEGWEEDVEMVAVEEEVVTLHGSIDGTGTTQVTENRERAQIREEDAYGVMVALADYLGYEVTGK